MINHLFHEVCEGCTHYINIGQATTECSKCDKIVHTKCYKKMKFSLVNKSHYCSNCQTSIPQMYNPFDQLETCNPHNGNNDTDNHYDQSFTESISTLQKASKILDNCREFNTNELISTEFGNFSSLFYNIDGNKTNFDTFSAELRAIKHKFSVIGLAETNTDRNHSDLYTLDGYKSYYNPIIDNKKSGSGVALYVCESFNATVLEHLSVTSDEIETLFIKIAENNTESIVGVVYRSPNSNFSEFLESYKTILNQLPPDKFTQILGDFNVNLFKSNDSTTSQFETQFLSEGFYPTISLQTHKRNNSKGSCIDNIFVNNTENIQFSGIIAGMGKHHSPIFTSSQLDLNPDKCSEKQTVYYDYSNEKMENFLEDLNDMSEESMGINDYSELNFSAFTKSFSTAIDKAFKLKIPKVTKRTFTNNPWITEGIIQAVIHKAKLYKDWKKSFSKKYPEGNQHLYEKFSAYRKCLKSIISLAKSKFYNTKILENSQNHKKTWEIINQLRGKTRKSIKPSFIINNKRITERRIIAQEFNKYFVSIALNMNKISNTNELGEVKISPIENFKGFMTKSISNSIFLNDTSTEEVSKIIKDLENGKSSDIPIKVIKKANSFLSPILAQHFNYLIKIGKFPDELKIGKITPIFKKDDEEVFENYRPISTLPIFAKIFEKIIYERLYSFLVSQKLLHSTQFGFRKSHSTSHAINYSVQLINDALENKKHVLGIFIDLSKAFDTIDHKILLSKLFSNGIRDNAYSLMESYLSNRKQYVNILGEKSDLQNVIYGIPQGSCLGPLLFLIYINDICNISDKGEFILFADDTNIFVKAETALLAYKNANEILKKVDLYMKANKLHINMDKCCFMHFNPDTKENFDYAGCHLKIGDEIIEKVTNTKFLGIFIDENLSWDVHINYLVKKLACTTGILNRVKENIPTELHKNLYHTLFESHLTYGITSWGGVCDNKLETLFKTQKKCIRILFGDKNAYLDKFKTCCRIRPLGAQKLGQAFYEKEHSKPLFNKQEIMNVYNLYVYYCCNEVLKIMKFRTPISMFNLFETSDLNPTLFVTPNPNLQFVYKASKIWNWARQIIIGKFDVNDYSLNIGAFKKFLKSHILKSQCLGSMVEWNNYRNKMIMF